MIPLVVDLETEWRGGQSQAFLLLKGLYERGHAAELIAPQGSALSQRAAAEGIYVHRVRQRLLRLRAAAMIRRVLSDGRIELVHVNEPHALTSAWLAGAHRKVPLLVSRRVAYRIQGPKRYLAAQRVLAISRFVKESLVASGIPEERIGLVYEGVEVPAPVAADTRASARRRWGVGEQETLLGCVGYLLPEKGQEFLVKALPAVVAKHPATKLILAGDGPCRAELEAYCRANGLAKKVIFAGFITEIAQVYAALDIFVFPSIAEPLGTSLLAAMAWGLPVVAVASGGVPEYVESGKTGLLVERPEAELISSALLRILDDAALRERLGRAAREEIRGSLSAETMVENTLAVYEALAGGR
ncbi:MAG TPA: glycosyltransferase family 4 protein [Methylomirabilota bacterium]|nr:glycosyltransferase family 4 protein [Methylomirabilota bacterium]